MRRARSRRRRASGRGCRETPTTRAARATSASRARPSPNAFTIPIDCCTRSSGRARAARAGGSRSPGTRPSTVSPRGSPRSATAMEWMPSAACGARGRAPAGSPTWSRTPSEVQTPSVPTCTSATHPPLIAENVTIGTSVAYGAGTRLRERPLHPDLRGAIPWSPIRRAAGTSCGGGSTTGPSSSWSTRVAPTWRARPTCGCRSGRVPTPLWCWVSST